MKLKLSRQERESKQYLIQTPLRDYQREALRVSRDRDCFAYLLAPRLGKTLIAIARANDRFRRGIIGRWTIVCPRIAKQVWANEIVKHSTCPTKVYIIKKADVGKRFETPKHPGFLVIVIMNYEMTWRRDTLMNSTPDMLTCDESQRIKHRGSKQSRVLQRAQRHGIRYRDILTGTLMNEPTDVFSQFKYLDPTIFGARFEDFCDLYVDKYDWGGFKPKTYKNLDVLQEKIHANSYILTREEAGGFPVEEDQLIEFSLDKELPTYKSMHRNLVSYVNQQEVRADLVIVQILRLQQITGGFLPVPVPDEDDIRNTPIGDAKMSALFELVQEFPRREPIVIFARFRYEIESMVNQLTNSYRLPGVIVGGMTDKERSDVIEDFQTGRLDTLVSQIRAGVAIDLSRARTAIFYSHTGSLIDYDQARARVIDRTGGKVLTVHLVAKGTVDEDFYAAVKYRENLLKRVLKVYSKDSRGSQEGR